MFFFESVGERVAIRLDRIDYYEYKPKDNKITIHMCGDELVYRVDPNHKVGQKLDKLFT